MYQKSHLETLLPAGGDCWAHPQSFGSVDLGWSWELALISKRFPSIDRPYCQPCSIFWESLSHATQHVVSRLDAPGLIWNGEFLALSGIRICRWFVDILHFEMHWTNSSFPDLAGEKKKSLGAFVKYAEFPAFALEILIQRSIFFKHSRWFLSSGNVRGNRLIVVVKRKNLLIKWGLASETEKWQVLGETIDR